MAKRISKQTAPPRKLSGPKSVFRRKVRARLSIVLTREGHVSLAANLARLGDLSRSDYYEALDRVFGAQLTREQVDALASTATGDR